MSERYFINGFTSTPVTVGTGATNGVYVGPVQGQNYFEFRVPVETIRLAPVFAGQSLSGTMQIQGASFGYPLTTMAIYSFYGSAAFFLMNTGATAIVSILRGLSPQSGGTFA